MAGKYVDNPDYLEYETLLKQLHRLIAESEGDSDAADTVRDEMDIPWRRLSREEIARLDGLSAELYMLSDNEVYEHYEGTQQQLLSDIHAAQEQEDWVRLLELLRRGPKQLSPPQIASLRARAYHALGQADTAQLFAAYAARKTSKVNGYTTARPDALWPLDTLVELTASTTSS